MIYLLDTNAWIIYINGKNINLRRRLENHLDLDAFMICKSQRSLMVNNLILVTHNVDEFSRVEGLQVEDWEAEFDVING